MDISAARTVAGATNQFAVILVDARSGERTVLWDRHPGAEHAAGRRAARGSHLGSDADRRLPPDGGRGVAGGPLRARRRACRRSSMSRKCVRASATCCRHIDVIIAARGISDRADRPRGARARARSDGARRSARRWSASRSARRAASRGATAAKCGRRPFQVDCVDSTGAGDVLSRRVRRRRAWPCRTATSRMCCATPTPPRR